MLFTPRFVQQYLSNGTTKHMHLSTATLNSMDFLWHQLQVMGTSVVERDSFVDMGIEWEIYRFACFDPSLQEIIADSAMLVFVISRHDWHVSEMVTSTIIRMKKS